MTVNILGTEYKVIVKKYDEDAEFARQSIDGYCNSYARQIVVCDMTTHPNYDRELPDMIAAVQKETLRHEIIHAFLSESGLGESSCKSDAWARNEKMVDWIAIQGPKIYAAWKEAGAL